MEKYFPALRTSALFAGIEEAEFAPLLSCLAVKLVRCEKGKTIFATGEHVKCFGIVLSGQVQVFQDDYYGNRSILAQMGAGNLFGESFACAEVEALPVTVAAAAESAVLLVEYRRLVQPCARLCAFHCRLIQNMLRIVSGKNVALTQKLEFASRRTTREKILSYLSVEAQRAGSRRFRIPFSRQELADYLFVDRSALSAELSRLRKDGILDFHMDQFVLHPAL